MKWLHKLKLNISMFVICDYMDGKVFDKFTKRALNQLHYKLIKKYDYNMFAKYPLYENFYTYYSFSNYVGYDTSYIKNKFLRFHMNRIFKYIKCIKNRELLRNCMTNMIYFSRAFSVYYEAQDECKDYKYKIKKGLVK